MKIGTCQDGRVLQLPLPSYHGGSGDPELLLLQNFGGISSFLNVHQVVITEHLQLLHIN